MDYLERILYILIITSATLKLSFQGDCNHSRFRYKEDGTCSGRLYSLSCSGKFFRDLLICDDIKPENLTEYNNLRCEYIEIRNSKFDNVTSELFRSFTSLQFLKIENSNVKYIDTETFDNLYRLETLELNGNSLSSMVGKFNGLTQLKTLGLSRNGIKDVSQNSLVKLPNLSELFLSDNKIIDMTPLLKGCQKLISLDLANNLIEHLQLENCSKLENLKISNNRLKEISKDMFANVSLIRFDVAFNKLDYLEDDFFENFVELKHLNISGNPLFQINDVPLGFFQNTKKLETLDLSSTFIKKLSVGTFSFLYNLRSLYLSWNNLTYLSETLLDSLHVNRLHVNGNKLSNLRYHVSIYTLDLRDNDWSCDVLSSIVSKGDLYNLIPGNVYNTSNVRGIPCYETGTNATDSVMWEKQYLLRLQEDQDTIKDALVKLNDFLNQSNFNQSLYLEEDLKDMDNILILRDVVLYCILFMGIICFAIFVYFYYKKTRI